MDNYQWILTIEKIKNNVFLKKNQPLEGSWNLLLRISRNCAWWFDKKSCEPSKVWDLSLEALSFSPPCQKQHIILVLYFRPHATINLWIPSYQFKLCWWLKLWRSRMKKLSKHLNSGGRGLHCRLIIKKLTSWSMKAIEGHVWHWCRQL